MELSGGAFAYHAQGSGFESSTICRRNFTLSWVAGPQVLSSEHSSSGFLIETTLPRGPGQKMANTRDKMFSESERNKPSRWVKFISESVCQQVYLS